MFFMGDNDSMTERKKRLRREILARRDALTAAQQRRAEVLITERILGHQWFYLSEILLGFVSYGSEISTKEILAEALAKGKKVYVPKVEGEEIAFYRMKAVTELVEGYKGILEPAGNTEKYEYDQETAKKTLLLMPGVGFDPYRNRMGYGKGFYDRFLSDKEGLWTRSIAIGHACQVCENIPADVRDVKPYQVITV